MNTTPPRIPMNPMLIGVDQPASEFVPNIQDLTVGDPTNINLPGTPLNPTLVPTEVVQDPATIVEQTQPQMVREKTGSTTTTTSQKIQPEESKQAGQDIQAATEKQKQAISAEEQAQIKMSEAQAKEAEEQANTRARVQNAYMVSQQKAMADIQNDIKSRDAAIAELVNQREETFWGNKSTGDRITAAVSIGLGSIGQALLGSGENVGMTLLKRNMDEFAANQRLQYEKQAKRIDAMNLSIGDKRQMLGQLEKQRDAAEVALLEKVKAKYSSILNSAKTSQVSAAAQKALAELDVLAATKRQEQADKYVSTRTSTVTRDTIEMIKAENTPEFLKKNKEMAGDIEKKLPGLSVVRSELAAGLAQLRDPSIPEEKKRQIADGLVKTINMTQGTSDAIGKEEVERLAAELQPSTGKLISRAGAGAASGAGVGMMVPLVGPLAGAAIGGAGGLAVGLGEELSKPGGVKFSPDLNAFTNRLEGALQKMDGTIGRSEQIAKLVRQGLSITQANALIDAQGGR